MRILQIKPYCSESVIKSFNNSFYATNSTFRPQLSQLRADTVSFTGKNYSVASLKNPTGHCGYCGAKVYSDNELNMMAQDLMSLKGNKLQGKIRSVTEKLGNKNSHNALVAKKAEVNKDYIDFFESFAEYSNKYPKIAGHEILKKYYHIEEKSLQDYMKKQLHPLLKTIDHVVPQREGFDNADSDSNLVEACDTCNCRIKNGMSFESFNFTFPSIKDEMPKDKYEFATMQLLQSSPSIASDQISTSELLKVIDSLFEQESAATLTLFGIRSKITKAKGNIFAAIDRIEQEQQAKRDEIEALELINNEHSLDEEYEVIKKRVILSSSISELKRQLSELRQSNSRTSNSVLNWSKKLSEAQKMESKQSSGNASSKNKNELSVKEIQRKLEETTEARDGYKGQIDELSPILASKEAELAVLNESHHDVDTLRAEKTRLETLISAHLQLSSLLVKQSENERKRTEIEQNIAALKSEVKVLESVKSNPQAQTQEQAEKKKRYIELEIALSQVDSSTQTKEQKVISSFARPQIVSEMNELSKEPSVVEYLDGKKLAELRTTYSTLNSTLGSLRSQDDSIRTQIVVQTTLIENNDKNISSDLGEESSGLLTCSLDRVNNQLKTLESYIAELETSIASIPEDKADTLPSSSVLYKEYIKLKAKHSEVNDKLCQQLSKSQREDLESEDSAIQQRIEEIQASDANSFADKNSFDYERLKEQREQLKKGLITCTSQKEKAIHQNQINAVEEQMQGLYEIDARIFNRINAEKRKNIAADLKKSGENRDNLILQRAEIMKKVQTSTVIGNGFNQDELQSKVDKITADIKRITEKTMWLEIPDREAKIRAEIAAMEQVIVSLRQKVNSIKSENPET